MVVGRNPKPKILNRIAEISHTTKLFISAARTDIGRAFLQLFKFDLSFLDEVLPPDNWISWSQFVRGSPKRDKDGQLPKHEVQ